MSNTHVIDITDFADQKPIKNSGWFHRRNIHKFIRISSGRRVIDETDAIQKLQIGFDIVFNCGAISRYDVSVQQQFSFGIMQKLYAEMGEDIFDRVEFNWQNSESHFKNFKREVSKKKAKNEEPVWLPPCTFFIPKKAEHFRVEEDWEFTLSDDWKNNDLLSSVYGKDSVIPNGKLQGVFLLKGSTFLIRDIWIDKDIRGLILTVEKGSKVEVGGITYEIKKESELHSPIDCYRTLICSLNEKTKQ